MAVVLTLGFANFILKFAIKSSLRSEQRDYDKSNSTSSDMLPQTRPLAPIPGSQLEYDFVDQFNEEAYSQGEESRPILENKTPSANWSGLDLYADGRIDDVHE